MTTTALELRPPANRVSHKAPWFWMTRALGGWAGIILVQILWFALVNDDHSGWHEAALVASAVLAAAHMGVMPQWRYRVHRWESTDQALYTQAGWFNQEQRIAPLSRIQTVDSQRGPIQQLFRLAKVTVTTASSAGSLTIQGLDSDTAQRLVDELTAYAEASRGDAT
jgi:membrane protein YdbS with pleckstrin-like domain